MASDADTHELAELLYGGRRYPSSYVRQAHRLLQNPQALMLALKRAGAVKDGPNGIGYVVVPPHKHDWRYAWGLLVCANEPCPDYGKPGRKAWPRIPNWNVLDPKTFPKYSGSDPTAPDFDVDDEEEDDDD